MVTELLMFACSLVPAWCQPVTVEVAGTSVECKQEFNAQGEPMLEPLQADAITAKAGYERIWVEKIQQQLAIADARVAVNVEVAPRDTPRGAVCFLPARVSVSVVVPTTYVDSQSLGGRSTQEACREISKYIEDVVVVLLPPVVPGESPSPRVVVTYFRDGAALQAGKE